MVCSQACRTKLQILKSLVSATCDALPDYTTLWALQRIDRTSSLEEQQTISNYCAQQKLYGTRPSHDKCWAPTILFNAYHDRTGTYQNMNRKHTYKATPGHVVKPSLVHQSRVVDRESVIAAVGSKQTSSLQNTIFNTASPRLLNSTSGWLNVLKAKSNLRDVFGG